MDPDSEKTNLINEEEQSTCPSTCPAVAYQQVTVSVPVTVTPFADQDEITVSCCDDPIITPRHKCKDQENGQCSFVITQKLCVSIPIEFGAKACVGDPFIHCCQPTTDDICSDREPTNHDSNNNTPNTNIPLGIKILAELLKIALKKTD